MRRIGILFTLLLLLVTSSCGGNGSKSSPAPVTGNKWTLMIYLDADNNLGTASQLDLEEMQAVGSTDNVTVIVQHDTQGGLTYRYKVEKGNLVQLANLGEMDMAQASTLRDFVAYAAGAFPADHYALILWNHGQGWKGASPDAKTKSILTDVDNGTFTPLSNQYVKEALASSGVTLDILGIDACEMSVLEAGYEFRNVTGILVASQELVSSYGWDYDDLLKRMTNNPSMTPAELAKSMVASFKNYYSASSFKDQTISALALKKLYSSDGTTDIAAVANAVDSLAANLMTLMADTNTRSSTLTLLTSARASVQEFDETSSPATYIDLVDFVRLVSGSNSAIEQALDKILLAEYHGPERSNAHGLSVVFFDRTSPYDAVTYDTNYRDYNSSTGKGSKIEFLNQFRWDDMLHMYYGYQYPLKPN
jgi:hypothetical protein